MTRALLYARYSSDLQSARSVADQLDLLRREAAARGWQVAAEFSDEAVSGASMATRPGLQALLAAAQRGGGEAVLAEALDRLSRDQADTALIHRALAFAEVRLVTLSEQDVTPLHVGFKGVMNSLFLAELAAKTRRGLAARVRSGASAGGLTFGYRTAGTGGLAIDEGEAGIVREIHRRFAAGESARRIAADLNRRGIAGPRGAVWQASTISGQVRHGNGILNNELYTGTRIWNRRRKVTDPVTGRKRMRENPPEAWICTAVPELAILTAAEWQATKDVQARFEDKRGGARHRPTRPLSGLIRCAACGGPMTITAKDRYGCSRRRQTGTCSETRTISAREIEQRSFAAIARLAASPEWLAASAADLRRRQAEADRAARAEQARLKAQLTRLAGQIRRAVDAIVEGHAGPALRDRLAALESEHAETTAALARIAEPSNVTWLAGSADARGDFLASLVEAAADESGGAEVRAALRGLMSAIEVRWPESGPADLAIEGDLAHLLDAETKRTPGDVSVAGGSLEVGAGTRTLRQRTALTFRIAA